MTKSEVSGGCCAEQPARQGKGERGSGILSRFRGWFVALAAIAALNSLAGEAWAQAAFQAAGTQQSGTGAVTVPWPAHQSGDIALLFVESRSAEAVTLSTPAGFAAVTNSPQFTTSDALAPNTGTRLSVFWARATSAAMASPTVADPGDHVYARILTYRRVVSSGTPWDVTGGGNKSGTNTTTLTVTGVTTTVANTRVVQAASRNNDSTAAAFSVQTNPGLTGIGERSDAGTTSGDGGGIGVWDGLRAVAGATGNTTVTVTASVNAFLTIALRPATTYYSRVTGNWSAGATWSTEGCGGVAAGAAPYAGSDVVICDTHTVTLDANSANLNSLTIQDTGVLNIGNSTTARTLTVSPAAPLPPGSIVNNGTLRYNTAANHVITTNGTFTNNDTFTSAAGIAGTRTLTVTGLITNTGTFRINGTAATTINANGGFTNSGTFDVDAASNLTHTFNVRATFTNNGTVQFRPDANSLVTTNFTTGAPVVGSVLTGSAGSTTFYNATVNNSGGLTLSGTHNMNVLNVLTLTTGPIITNANYVYVASTTAIGSVGGNDFVIGNLRMNFNAGANITRVFAVGSGLAPNARYTPVNIRFGSVTTAGDFTVSTTGGDHPQIGTSPVNPAQSVNRYWTLTNDSVGFQSVNGNNRIIFTYVNPADIDAGVAPPFVVGRYNTPSWTSITPSAVAVPNVTLPASDVTNATMAGTADYVIGEAAPVVPAPGDFNAFETSTAANAITGKVFTKLVGVNFSLDIVAILAGAQHATFTNTVAVDLVTGSTGGLNCPGTPVAIAGTSQNVNLASGRGTTAAFNIAATAYRDVRVRVRFPVSSPTVTSCSTDNFAIRPTGLTVTSTNASGGTAATNTATTGTPAIKTGANFNLRATALAGYDGTPSINNTLVTGTPTAGTIGGSFAAAAIGTGIADGNAFYYSEVGHFGLGTNAVFDSGFTSVDSGGGDCTNDFSNALVGGRYGCNFGSAAVTQTTGVSGFGRFIPDNFNVSVNVPVLAPACTGFSYVGQNFNYSTAPVMTITARNGTSNGLTNATTVNYAGSYMKFANDNTSLAQAAYDTQAERYARFDALGGGNTPALDLAGLPATSADPAIGTFTNGVGTFTFSGGGGLAFVRNATTPSAAFDADIALALNVVDADGVAFAGNPAAFGAASAGNGMLFSDGNALTTNDKAQRHGRLRVGGASGTPLLSLRVPFEVQYWNGTAFVTNVADTCTTIAAANVGLGNISGGISTTVSAVSALQSGRGTITLAKPTSGSSGSVDVAVNLGTGGTANACPAFTPAATAANKPFLQGRWCGATTTRDPSTRVRFGINRGSDQSIYRREP
jgi:hypothetical protein